MKTWEERRTYMKASVVSIPVKQRRQAEDSRRQRSLVYRFRINDQSSARMQKHVLQYAWVISKNSRGLAFKTLLKLLTVTGTNRLVELEQDRGRANVPKVRIYKDNFNVCQLDKQNRAAAFDHKSRGDDVPADRNTEFVVEYIGGVRHRFNSKRVGGAVRTGTSRLAPIKPHDLGAGPGKSGILNSATLNDLRGLQRQRNLSEVTRLVFVMNVGTDAQGTFISSSTRSGCHWSLVVVDIAVRAYPTTLYCDSLGWECPSDLGTHLAPFLRFSGCGSYQPTLTTLAHHPTVHSGHMFAPCCA
ncbi:hypothetical protein BaRGS_00024602 [Batillaria attramentaria]|uniref:Uncharacterized protein n=1 Tax=Batillaria attramentaria TaxID=370345 RepID=A0ABD0KAJ7_9CAEN